MGCADLEAFVDGFVEGWRAAFDVVGISVSVGHRGETILFGASFDVGTFTDPSSLNGLYVRAFGASVDTMTISAVVPEPHTAVLLGSGIVALMLAARKDSASSAPV